MSKILKSLMIAAMIVASLFITKSGFCRTMQDEVVYFVMTDRFFNGDPVNDRGGLLDSVGPLKHGYNPSDKGFFHGGDLVGLKKKLPYLKNLGVTAIWITPVFKNQSVQFGPIGEASAGYHGYWITDFLNVDPHLGSNDDMKMIVEAAHKIGLKVILDIVINHTADVIKFRECHRDDGSYKNESGCPYRNSVEIKENSYTPFIPRELANAKNPSWLNDPQYYHNQGNSMFSGESVERGDFFGLDDLYTEQKRVLEGMIEISKFWIKEFKIDGYRVDTVKHVNLEFWKAWISAVKDYAKAQRISPFYIFGEVFDMEPPLVARYVREGGFPATLDFPLQGAIKEVFGGHGPTRLLEKMFENDDYYVAEGRDSAGALTFTGNHDIGRFAFFVTKELPKITAEEVQRRVKLAYAFLLFARGTPVIYYGDEQGLSGEGGDQDARQDMPRFDESYPIYKAIKKYAAIRKAHPALSRGIQLITYSEDKPGLLVFSRVDPRQKLEYLVLFNTASERRKFIAKTKNVYESVYPKPGVLLKPREGVLTITIDPMDFSICRAKKPVLAPKIAPQAEIEKPAEGEIISGLTEITAGGKSIPDSFNVMQRMVFYADVEGKGLRFLGRDYTPPYRVFWNTEEYPNKTKVMIRAVLESGFGQETVGSHRAVIDARVPAEIWIRHENQRRHTMVLAITRSGEQLGPFTLQEGVAKIPWSMAETGMTLFFETPGDREGSFKIDQPNYIEKRKLLKSCKENKGGELDAELVFKEGEDLLQRDLTPYKLEQKAYLRGSFNGWKAGDPLSELSPGVYMVKKKLTPGEYEFKFADENWRELNFGSPFDESGLTNGQSSNLKIKIVKDGIYRFYLFFAALNGKKYAFHQILIDVR